MSAKALSILIILIIALLLSSCSSSKNIVVKWNVELKDSDVLIQDKCNPDKKLQSIKSAEKPEMLPATEERDPALKVTGIPCAPEEEEPVYIIPMSRVKRITYLSDPLLPPDEIPLENLPAFSGCCRDRVGLWIFDKFELRGAIGYRGTDEQIAYLQPDGTEKIYKSKIVGFDRGGSTLIFGLETAGMWNLPFLDVSGKLQAGFLLGFYPTDESYFFPLGLNVRYTFNQHPAGNFSNCNSWYLFGNIGMPVDFKTGAPYYNSDWDFQRYFYGFGIGYDWAINCKVDFSLDLGYRNMNLPLPACEVCSETPDKYKYPFRNSDVLLLRFGITY